jgi:hypothetical protein
MTHISLTGFVDNLRKMLGHKMQLEIQKQLCDDVGALSAHRQKFVSWFYCCGGQSLLYQFLSTSCDQIVKQLQYTWSAAGMMKKGGYRSLIAVVDAKPVVLVVIINFACHSVRSFTAIPKSGCWWLFRNCTFIHWRQLWIPKVLQTMSSLSETFRRSNLSVSLRVTVSCSSNWVR